MQLGQEHLSKGIGCNDDHLEAETLKGDNVVKREGSLDFTSLKEVPHHSILVDKPGAYVHSTVDDLTNGNQNGHELVPCSLPLPQFELVKKETQFYMDKAVTQMELPKMIVCYKEGSYHIIKDICVDEGLHSFDSVLVQNAAKDGKAYYESNFFTEDFSNKHISDSLKSSTLNGQLILDVNNEVTEHASLGDAPKEHGDVSHTTGGIVSRESQENDFDEMLFPSQESNRCQSPEQIIDIPNKNATQQSLASLLEDRCNTDTAEEIVHASETKERLPVQELDMECCHADLLSFESSMDQPRLAHSDIDKPKSIKSEFEEDRCNTDTAGEIVHASETKERLPVQELDMECCHADLLSFESSMDQPHLANSDIDKPKSIKSEFEESQSSEVDSHQLKSVGNNCPGLASISKSTAETFSVHDSCNRGDQVDEGALEEANSTTSGVSSEELKEVDKAKDFPSIGDSGANIVAFDIDSEPLVTIPKKNCKGTTEIQQFELVTNSSMLEHTSTDGTTASSQTLFSHGHADANSLGPASLSGRIAYSGQIPYSGSISLRSDSSTTSTRSFAFPILQPEWNSSPVRMAKADRRHFRRHRGWRSGLFCCRF